jgi:DNA (cytosine-5)-methyltransferase 1
MKESIKVFEMFSGYGGANFALSKANILHECVGYSEIDKSAIGCYKMNFPKVKNFGDCTLINVEDLPDFDLLTGGFPCQPFSEAGKHKGELDIRGTLFYDVIRIAENKKPRFMLLENVKGLTFKNHQNTFKKILSELNRIGYEVFWKVMNSKNYGTPQSRERVYFVCIRKDIEQNFMFPKSKELDLFLKDIILGKVDKKYFLTDQKIQTFEKDRYPKDYEGLNNIFIPDFDSHIISVAIRNKNRSNHQHRKVPYGTFPVELHLRYNRDIGVSFAVKSAVHEYYISDIKLNNIRSLTPKECFRLMGFFDDEINLKGMSNSALYKLAGNGWDINIVSQIFTAMFSSVK